MDKRRHSSPCVVARMTTARCGLNATTAGSFRDQSWRRSGGSRLSIANAGIPAPTKFFPPMWLQFAKLRLQNMQADMTGFLPWRAYAPKIFALAALLSLGGCIDSLQPLLTGTQPLLGNRPNIAFYVLRDGAATEPMTETFAWRDSRYVPIHSTASDLHDF